MYQVYGREKGCPKCLYAKSILKAKGKEFTFLEISNFEGIAEVARESGILELPVIYKEGELLGGLQSLMGDLKQ